MHVENLLTLADMEMAGNDDTHQHSERAGSACCASGTDLVRFRLVKRSYRIVLKKGNVGHCFFPNISREAESFMLQKTGYSHDGGRLGYRVPLLLEETNASPYFLEATRHTSSDTYLIHTILQTTGFASQPPKRPNKVLARDP